jgi:hypothetical protein
MAFQIRIVRGAHLAVAGLVLALAAAPARAQVTEVVVGVTPTCPYGISACWAGAYEGLGKLEGVKSVARQPDAFNNTAHVYLKYRGLPDPAAWAKQFQDPEKGVGNAYKFRGVEVTVKGNVEEQGGKLVVRVPGLKQPLPLLPLTEKLQWNFKKAAARQPEPDERDAHQQLTAARQKARGTFRVEVTGPLRAAEGGPGLEVREFFALPPLPGPKD